MRNKLKILLILVAMLAILASTFVPVYAEQRTLLLGSRGEDVAVLQRKLNQVGYHVGPVDGIYGSKTEKAVRTLQSTNGLVVDGITGPKTLAALEKIQSKYVVKSGESLWKIANRFGISVNSLKQANGLTHSVIYPGQTLVIPTSIQGNTAMDNDDIKLIARLVHAEARGESFSGKVAVASVVLNRARDNRFPNTISGVIFEKHQFEPVDNGSIWLTPSKEAYSATRDAINGWDPSNGAVFFYNPSKVSHTWLSSRSVTARIGNHVFLR